MQKKTPLLLSRKPIRGPHIVIRHVEIAGIVLPIGILHAIPRVVLNVVVQIKAGVSVWKSVLALGGALLDDVADVGVGVAVDVLRSISQGHGVVIWIQAISQQ